MVWRTVDFLGRGRGVVVVVVAVVVVKVDFLRVHLGGRRRGRGTAARAGPGRGRRSVRARLRGCAAPRGTGETQDETGGQCVQEAALASPSACFCLSCTACSSVQRRVCVCVPLGPVVHDQPLCQWHKMFTVLIDWP